MKEKRNRKEVVLKKEETQEEWENWRRKRSEEEGNKEDMKRVWEEGED